MTKEKLQQILEAAKYRYAYTMRSWCPHWYTLRKTWDDDKLFEECVQAIRDLGEVRPWPEGKPKYWHTYFDAGEWSYWSMGAPLGETTLINRARPKPPEAG